MSQVSYQEGDVVIFNDSLYWVSELRMNSRVRLLPLDAINFDEGIVYNLSKTIEVDITRIKLAKHNLR